MSFFRRATHDDKRNVANDPTFRDIVARIIMQKQIEEDYVRRLCFDLSQRRVDGFGGAGYFIPEFCDHVLQHHRNQRLVLHN